MLCRFVLCCLLYKSFCPNICYKYAKIVLCKSPHTFFFQELVLVLNNFIFFISFFGALTMCGDGKVMEHVMGWRSVYCSCVRVRYLL